MTMLNEDVHPGCHCKGCLPHHPSYNEFLHIANILRPYVSYPVNTTTATYIHNLPSLQEYMLSTFVAETDTIGTHIEVVLSLPALEVFAVNDSGVYMFDLSYHDGWIPL